MTAGEGPAPGGPARWFEPLADHLGEAYLRYSFTKGTEQEVDFLVEALGLQPGRRVLDVGCGPGRHAHALARRGLRVVGVDLSERFVRVAARTAPPGSAFVRADAARLPVRGVFDAVISLCQGGFGLQAGPLGSAAAGEGRGDAVDEAEARVLRALVGALRPGGTLALSAFSAYFQVRYLEDPLAGGRPGASSPGAGTPSPAFDATTGVHAEDAEVRDPAGRPAVHRMWTTCFTPRELRLLVRAAGCEPLAVWAVEPGAYERRPADVEHPEFLVLARKAGGTLPERPAS